MCTQSLSSNGTKFRTNLWALRLRFGMHTLTSELQEVIVGLIVCPCGLNIIFWIDTPHCLQLNNTISTLPLTKCVVSVKSKVIRNWLDFTVSSWLAHMFPSNSVSVGTIPSNRTEEVGSRQVDVPLLVLLTTIEQCPVAEDPLTAEASLVLKV